MVTFVQASLCEQCSFTLWNKRHHHNSAWKRFICMTVRDYCLLCMNSDNRMLCTFIVALSHWPAMPLRSCGVRKTNRTIVWNACDALSCQLQILIAAYIRHISLFHCLSLDNNHWLVLPIFLWWRNEVYTFKKKNISFDTVQSLMPQNKMKQSRE